MANVGVIRVYPSEGRWAVKKDGASRVSSRHDTKEEAYRAAREIALNQGLDIIVHWKNGKIQKRVRPKDMEQDDCFITTACVNHFNLSDDCYQLQLLRRFRDEYMLSDNERKQLVGQYYAVAPTIVVKLNKHPDRIKFYNEVFSRINEACIAIENGEFQAAKEIYIQTVLTLTEQL